MSKLTKAALDKIIHQRTQTIHELFKLDGVPIEYLTGVAAITVGMSYIQRVKGKEHLVRILRGWADNIEKDRKTNEI